MSDFIKIKTYFYKWNGSKDVLTRGKDTYIRLGSIANFSELYTDLLHDETAVKLSEVHTYNVVGKGINGVSSTIYIDEDSFNKLLWLFEIEPRNESEV